MFPTMDTPSVTEICPKSKAWCLSLGYWRLETPRASFATRDGWFNEDVDVVPLDKRTWNETDYLWVWLADGAKVGTMQQAGSILGSPWDSAGVKHLQPLQQCRSSGTSHHQILTGCSDLANLHGSAVGNVLVAMTVALNGAIGSIHHIPFSIALRASMGFYFSYFAVISRLALSLIYFG
jgi:nucleobase:cation symporter-1, NCS1 family